MTVNVVPRTCPCSIWNDSLHARRASNDTSAVELGVKFRSDVERLHHRASLLQDAREHRHPRRPPVDGGRHPARRGHVHRRDGVRLAGGRLRAPRCRSRRTPPTSPPITRRTATTRPATATSRTAASTTPRCTRSATASTGRTASTGTGPPAACSPAGARTPSSRATTGSTSSSTPTSGPDTTPPTISARSPRSGASGVATGAERHGDLQRADGRGHDRRHHRSSCAIPRTRSVPATVSYNAAQTAATLDPTGPLQHSTDVHGDGQGRRRRGQGRGRQRARQPTTPGRSRRPRRRRRRPTRARAGRSW